MKSFYWPSLTEEQRYSVWSLHIEMGGKDINYPEFCELMDNLHA